MAENPEVTEQGPGKPGRAIGCLVAAFAAVIATGLVAYLFFSFTLMAPRENKGILPAQSGLEGLLSALSRYKAATGSYPTTDQGLEALIRRPVIEPIPERWIMTTVPSNLVDPWGNPFRYRHPGARNPNSFDLWSFGPDGENGTSDDIIGW